MAKIFPASPIPIYPFDLEMEYKTVVSPYDNGDEQRRSKWQFPKYNFVLAFDNLSLADMRTLWQFYQECKGSLESVYYFLPWSDVYLNLYIGVGNAVTQIYDLPGKSTSGHAVYFDGVVQGSGWSVLTGGGTGSADRLSFVTAPASGKVITVGMAGLFRVKCRFKNDKLSRRLFEVLLFNTGIEMKGLGGA
jgi:hypothetical protein